METEYFNTHSIRPRRRPGRSPRTAGVHGVRNDVDGEHDCLVGHRTPEDTQITPQQAEKDVNPTPGA